MSGWLEQVGNARTGHELCELTRDYVATFTPTEMATLPKSCWPRVKAVDDLRYWHDRLADDFCGCDKPGDTHRKLVAFFSAVIERLAVVEAAHEDVAANDRAISCGTFLPARKRC